MRNSEILIEDQTFVKKACEFWNFWVARKFAENAFSNYMVICEET
jgi:hypothetical protein